MKTVCVLILFEILTSCVSHGFLYKCYRDICDSDTQFCNDKEERCGTCTPEECSKEAEYELMNQCERFCGKADSLVQTNVVSTKKPTPMPTPPDIPYKSADSVSWMSTGIIILVVMSGTLIFLVSVILYIVWKRSSVSDIEKGLIPNLTLSTEGSCEKEPLLNTQYPVQANTVSNASERDENKVRDANILKEAIASPMSIPPSYTTTDIITDEHANANPIIVSNEDNNQQQQESSKSAGAQESGYNPQKENPVEPAILFRPSMSMARYQNRDEDVTQTGVKY